MTKFLLSSLRQAFLHNKMVEIINIIIISTAFYGDKDTKMDHSIFRTKKFCDNSALC